MKSFFFIPELTKAVISGQKTQTRRLIKDCDVDAKEFEVIQYLIHAHADYKVGEVAYIREGFRFPKLLDKKKPSQVVTSPVEYRLGGTQNCIGQHIKDPGKWRSPLHHPTKFARHFVIVTNVRVEQLNNITGESAKKEGIHAYYDTHNYNYGFKDYLDSSKFHFTPYASFRSLWESIYGEELWNTNPWVFVYAFKKCDKSGIEL